MYGCYRLAHSNFFKAEIPYSVISVSQFEFFVPIWKLLITESPFFLFLLALDRLVIDLNYGVHTITTMKTNKLTISETIIGWLLDQYMQRTRAVKAEKSPAFQSEVKSMVQK